MVKFAPYKLHNFYWRILVVLSELNEYLLVSRANPALFDPYDPQSDSLDIYQHSQVSLVIFDADLPTSVRRILDSTLIPLWLILKRIQLTTFLPLALILS